MNAFEIYFDIIKLFCTIIHEICFSSQKFLNNIDLMRGFLFYLLGATFNKVDIRPRSLCGGGQMRLPLITLIIVSLISLGSTEMPASYYAALEKMPNLEIICVKNYQAGSSITEAYTDFEYVDKDTQIISRAYNITGNNKGQAILEASISSDVTGRAHLAWQSRDPVPDKKGRYTIISLNKEDLTGVFSIDKFIQLWSNSSAENMTSLNWLPCL
jgi:hypothetical protein